MSWQRVLWIGFICSAGTLFGRTLPFGGTELDFAHPFEGWRGGGKLAVEMSVEQIAVTNQPFASALEVTTAVVSEGEYDYMLTGQTSDSIRKGDHLLLSFFGRCKTSSDESALGKFTVVGSVTHPKYQHVQPFSKTYSPDENWQHYLIPFEAPLDNVDQYGVNFLLGGIKPQTLQIANLRLLNYEDSKTLEQLPVTETAYAGMEEDAPWRAEAAARIEEYRKGDMRVVVVDHRGRPKKNVKVHFELKRHEFGFGAAVRVDKISGRGAEPAYRDAILELFNRVTFENRLKWKYYREKDPDLAEAIDWCKEQGLDMRGHCMIWPDWARIPRKLADQYKDNPEGFPEVIEANLRKMAMLYPDAFIEWDVANELYKEHTFMDLFGKEIVADWYRIVKETNPSFKNYMNDYAILAGNDEKHRQGYYDWIEYLQSLNAPIEGIGFQGHFRAPVPPEEIYRRLEQFAVFGLDLQVTEYDFDETDEELQRRFTRDFMTVVFSHPQMTGIVTWCLWEASCWKPNAAFYATDWTKRPIAEAWESLVKDEWHTDVEVTTDRDGIATARGFLGDYDITVSYLGKKKGTTATLTREGSIVEVQLR